VPLIGYFNLTGILSLGRLTHSPFSKTEKDTAQVFASRIAQLIESKRTWSGKTPGKMTRF